MNRNYLSLILFIILVDYVLKFIVSNKVKNYGAAFDILENYHLFLLIVSFLAFIFFIYLFYEHKEYKLGLSFLIAGTVSNLIDRILLGYVVDYIPFFDIFYFNLGDLSNFIGILILIFYIFKKPNLEEEQKVLKKDLKRRREQN